MQARIFEMDRTAIAQSLASLAAILVETVQAGGAVSFLTPLSVEEARRFWSHDVGLKVSAGERVLFVAEYDGSFVGTVQLITAMPPNQTHRCEIAKMMVHPRARRLGIGRELMKAALEKAGALGKRLVTLDTRTDDAAETLYLSLGFEVAGTIPGYAWDPDGQAKHATTYMYRDVPSAVSNRPDPMSGG